MDKETKENLRKSMKDTELKVAESLLRWKYKKEGKALPEHNDLKIRSRLFRDKARKTISKRGKNIWNEFKNAYLKKGP